MRLDASDMAGRLGARGLRLTRQRRAVVETLAQSEAALTALQLYDAGRRRCPDLGLTTVYRTLDALGEAGAIRRVHADGHCEAFVPAESAHGHSVVCVGCGRVGEFTDCDVSSLVERAARETGFAIEEHFIQLSGMCAACQARAATAAGAGREAAATHAPRPGAAAVARLTGASGAPADHDPAAASPAGGARADGAKAGGTTADGTRSRP